MKRQIFIRQSLPSKVPITNTQDTYYLPKIHIYNVVVEQWYKGQVSRPCSRNQLTSFKNYCI
jgi:hypothetical protein